MPVRLLHILLLNVVLFSIATLANAADLRTFSGNEAGVSLYAGAAPASRLSITREADISAPGDKHSTPCYLECQPPFLRCLSQEKPTLPGKADAFTYPSILLPSLAVASGSGWLNGQIPIILFNPPGSPYQAHRARTARQLT